MKHFLAVFEPTDDTSFQIACSNYTTSR